MAPRMKEFREINMFTTKDGKKKQNTTHRKPPVPCSTII